MPEYFISANKFVSWTSDLLFNGYGNKSEESCYHGGTFYTDSGSGIINVEPKVSVGLGKTLVGK